MIGGKFQQHKHTCDDVFNIVDLAYHAMLHSSVRRSLQLSLGSESGKYLTEPEASFKSSCIRNRRRRKKRNNRRRIPSRSWLNGEFEAFRNIEKTFSVVFSNCNNGSVLCKALENHE